jgi:hypothetical protein
MKKSEKIVNPSGFWNPVNMGTSGFRKLFYDCTSDILNSLNQ